MNKSPPSAESTRRGLRRRRCLTLCVSEGGGMAFLTGARIGRRITLSAPSVHWASRSTRARRALTAAASSEEVGAARDQVLDQALALALSRRWPESKPPCRPQLGWDRRWLAATPERRAWFGVRKVMWAGNPLLLEQSDPPEVADAGPGDLGWGNCHGGGTAVLARYLTARAARASPARVALYRRRNALSCRGRSYRHAFAASLAAARRSICTEHVRRITTPNGA